VSTDRSTALVAARYARGTAAAAVLVATLWHVVYDVPAVLGNWTAYRAPYASAAVWVVYTAVGAVASWLVLRGRSVAWVEALGLAVLGIGVPAVIVAGAPVLTFTAGNWVWGTFGWYAILLLWWRPLFVLLAALAGNGLVVLGTVALTEPLDRLDLARWGMIVYGTSSLQLLLAGGARVLERDAARSARAAAARRAVEHRRVAAEATHAARRRRYRAYGRSAGDLLARLASGAADPGDPAVQRAAAVEAARLRRLLAEHDDVPDPLLHELRASADVAERRGVLVELRPVGVIAVVGPEARRSLTEPVLHVLAAAHSHARVTVAGDDRAIRVAVVADVAVDGAPRWVGGDGGAEVATDRHGGTLWVQTTWPVTAEAAVPPPADPQWSTPDPCSAPS
jgi:hypothetical protein